MQSFNPPKRILMGPGPSDIHERVLNAMARPTVGHLDPTFVGLMDEIKILLKRAFRTENKLTFPISAPGSAGMETCFVNLVEPGDKVIVCINGVFGNRMVENVKRVGATPITVTDDWGRPVDPNKVEDALKNNPGVKAVAFVHAETSTGASSDAKSIASLAQQYNAMSIVDAVTSLGGSELRVDEWGLDAVYSGSQKCLSAPPGISPVTFSDRAIDVINNRKTPCQSWFLDLSLVMNYWNQNDGGGRSYHHTAPVNAMYALHEALLMLDEEGVENSWKRHRENHQLLKTGLNELGIEYVVEEPYRLAQLNAVTIPAGVDDKEVRMKLLNDHNLEIGGGLGALAGKVWRIGLMGAACTRQNVDYCLKALKTVL